MRSKILVVEDEAAINDLICLSWKPRDMKRYPSGMEGRPECFWRIAMQKTAIWHCMVHAAGKGWV